MIRPFPTSSLTQGSRRVDWPSPEDGGPRLVFPSSHRSFPTPAVFSAVILRFCCRAAVNRPRAPFLVTMSLHNLMNQAARANCSLAILFVAPFSESEQLGSHARPKSLTSKPVSPVVEQSQCTGEVWRSGRGEGEPGSVEFGSQRESHRDSRAEVVVTDGSLVVADSTQFGREVAHDREPERLVEGRVPRNISVRGEGDRIEALCDGPGGDGFHQQAPQALPGVVGVHRQLPDVKVGIHQVDTHEAHRRLANHQDEGRRGEVVVSVVVRERTDADRLEQSVGRELDVTKGGELIGPGLTNCSARAIAWHR